MTRIYAGIQRTLQDQNVASNADAVVKFLMRVRWEESDKPEVRKVETHLRIHGRLTPESMEMLDCCESLFGRQHALATVTSLDQLAARTSCNNTEL